MRVRMRVWLWASVWVCCCGCRRGVWARVWVCVCGLFLGEGTLNFENFLVFSFLFLVCGFS